MKEFHEAEPSNADTSKTQAAPTAQTVIGHYSTFRRHPIRWVVAGIALFLLVLSLLALSMLAHLVNRFEREGGPNSMFGGYSSQRNQDGGRTMMRHAQTPSMSSTDNRVVGVVTEVNGDSFTVAGNGTTKTVKTNSSTVYNTAGNKVAVNDSVSVIGTTNGDTFTATRVMVKNQ